MHASKLRTSRRLRLDGMHRFKRLYTRRSGGSRFVAPALFFLRCVPSSVSQSGTASSLIKLFYVPMRVKWTKKYPDFLRRREPFICHQSNTDSPFVEFGFSYWIVFLSSPKGYLVSPFCKRTPYEKSWKMSYPIRFESPAERRTVIFWTFWTHFSIYHPFCRWKCNLKRIM